MKKYYIYIPILLVLLTACPSPWNLRLATKSITAFAFKEADNPALPTDAKGEFSLLGNVITVKLPPYTDVTGLKPSISISGVNLSPASGEARDFTNTVNYTVTAEDDSTAVYWVNVITAPGITAFEFKVADNPVLSADVTGTIDHAKGSIVVKFPPNILDADIRSLKPTITIDGGSLSLPPGRPRTLQIL